MNAMMDGFVAVDGHRLHYVEAGAGAPLVLLHSGGASCHQYAAVMPLLAKTHRVIAWDMLGHGDSDPLVAHRTMEEHGALLGAFTAALGLDRYVLSGSSIGGYIAMAHAVAVPTAIERVVVVEAPLRSPAWYAENWAGFEAMCAIPENSRAEITPRFREVTPALHRRWNIDRSKAGSWTMVDIAWACRDFDAGAAFAAIAPPLSVIVGSKGPTIGERERMESLRPGVSLTVLGDCGHFPMVDEPGGFAAALLTQSPRLA